MKLVKLKAGDFEIREIDGADLRVLGNVVREADATGHAAAEDRLFPDPLASGSGDDEESGFLDDWHSLVRPDLKDSFDGALAIYQSDLRKAAPDPGGDGRDGPFSLRVPADHAEAWLSALNQARLVMNAKHALPESEDIEDLGELVASGKLEPFLLSRFYASVQEWLVYHYL